MRSVNLASALKRAGHVPGGDDPTHHGQAPEFCRSLEYLCTIEFDIFLSNHSSFFDLATKAEAKRAGNDLAVVDDRDLGRFLSNAAASTNTARETDGLQRCHALVESINAPAS